MVAMSFKIMPEKGKLIIHFENYVGDKPLALDTATYTNAMKQNFTVTNFKYYISNIKLKGTNGNIYSKDDGYYLIKQDDESTWTAELDEVPDASYSGVSFTVGVDSLHNCSGAQSGALDPINGMFWTWSSGYVFMKLEGKSPVSKQPGHIFEYHIGGYREPNNFIRTVNLKFDKGPMNIKTDKTTRLYIKTDAAKILAGKNKIDIAKLSSVTDFHNASKIADNYVDMFSVIRMSNEW
jgi:hypothetical protein